MGIVGSVRGSGSLADDLFGGGGLVGLDLAAAAEVLHHQADDRFLALRLVVDVERDGDQEHEALDDLGEVGADAEELQAVVQHGHHQAADDRADHGADAAGDRGAADEDGRDGVQFPADAVERARGGGAADEDHAGEAGQEGHVHHDQEVDLLGLDAGELGGVPVAADRVDVAADDGLGGDEAVDEDQDGEDQAGDREGRARPAGGEEVGRVEDGAADQDQFEDHDPGFGNLGAEGLGVAAGADLAEDHERDARAGRSAGSGCCSRSSGRPPAGSRSRCTGSQREPGWCWTCRRTGWRRGRSSMPDSVTMNAGMPT